MAPSWELGRARRAVLSVASVICVALVGLGTDPGIADATAANPPQEELGVGRQDLTLVDPTRPTPADPRRGWPEKPDRTLETIVLYPTDPTDEDPQAVADGTFPLVVFSHGFTASGQIYAGLMEPLVRRGYIVALPTFPLSSGPMGNFLDFVNQPGDVSFVIDEMIRLTKDTGSWLHGHVNKHRIAAAGHSLGAITTLGVTYNRCCLDARIDAAIPLSGGPLAFPGGEYTWPDVPLLLIHGVQDIIAPVWASDLVFELATGKTFYLRLNEADHVNLFIGADGALTAQAMGTFLDAKLKGRWRPLDRFAQVVADSGRAEWRVHQ